MSATPKTALLLVDVQYDFCEGGSLSVPDSQAVFPAINRLIAEAEEAREPIIAYRDWHPVDHCSFESWGGPWPVHCIQDSHGAAFHEEMDLPDDAVRVSKGTSFDQDNYSAFDGTGLSGYLRRLGVEQVRIAGLALDVCVQATVDDALGEGFGVELVADATRAVEPEATNRVLGTLKDAGARIV
ncbi:nicotinamidase/pyrazinamidase [Tamilnaduibacter salinus]|uniref:nicotinamidase n=1 Tax=Tamilnaduibacter salinus TaxID=1484056 RepID=A0A2U1CVL6_9GAMM|nr:isochorismatase family protein [Tamilnaduibacter salinus]PVY75786.1 nicotinamidase/pyrazinamidase [Tamilnaduibacter salinus]